MWSQLLLDFFFFLISNKNILKRRGGVTRVCMKYTSRTKTNQVHKVQKSMKSWTGEKERKPNIVTQSRRVLRKKSLRSKTDLSKSSKCRLFLSLQIHHIKQCCTAIQIVEFWCLPNFPCQQANNSPTIFGITQWMPNKVNTIYHKSKAIVQQMRRWSTDSPFLLHIQQQSKIQICCFLRLSIVKIFPKVAVHTKKQFYRGP